MIEDTKSAAIRHITVAVDTSLRALSALELAAALAARSQASLEALYVEDINLFALAALPFARELDTTSGAERSLNEPHIISSLRTHQQRVRKALERAAEQRQLRTAVRVKRGHYVTEALEAASSVDVLFLTSAGRIRYTAQSAAARTLAPGPVWVLFDGGPSAARALRLAAELSEAQASPLGVVVLAQGDAEAARMTQAIKEVLGRDPPPGALRAAAADLEGIRQTVAAAGCSLLLLPRERAALVAEPSGGLLEVLDCPLVVVS